MSSYANDTDSYKKIVRYVLQTVTEIGRIPTLMKL